MKKKHIKLLSLILVLVLTVNLILPTSVFATGETSVDAQPTENGTSVEFVEGVKEPKDPAELQAELDAMTYEITSLRDENIKHFQLPDGTYQAVVYGEPVHRLNADGVWEEIDNTLTETNGMLVTESSRIKFAKKITGNHSLYTLHDGSYKITIGLVNANKKVEGVVNNHVSSEEGMTKLQKLIHIDNISSDITYPDILNGVDLEYVIVSNSIKENIIVKEPADSYQYTFTLDLNGLTAELVNENILLCDSSSGEVVYSIPAPYLYDAAGNESFDAYYTLSELATGKYEFTLIADAAWLNAAERSFPVTIDPSLIDLGQIEDTYVSSLYTTRNYGSSAALWVSPTHETYYRFTKPNLPNNINITSATVKFPYYYDTANNTYANVGLYEITSNWKEEYAAWSTKPSTASTCLSTKALYPNGATASSPRYVAFGATSSVQSWYSGSGCYGFALKYADGSATSVKFVSKEAAQVYAQLTINYTGTHLAQGVYAIKRSDANYYFKTYLLNGLSWVLQDTTSYTSPPVTSSHWENLIKIAYRPNTDDYVIRSMLDNMTVIYPSIANNAPVAGRRTESNSGLSSSYTWDIEYVDGYYYISHTANGTKYYIRSANTWNDGKLVLTTNANDSGTKWSFHQYTGNPVETVSVKDFDNSIYVGDAVTYRACSRSTRVDLNGIISISITNTDAERTPTDKAEIDSSTGSLRAYKPGEIFLRVTYSGAPSIWNYRIVISTLPCSGYEIAYTPSIWNDTNALTNSNCYNYALNIRCASVDDIYESMEIGDPSGNDIENCIEIEPIGNESIRIYHALKSQAEIESIIMEDALALGLSLTPIEKNEVCPAGTYKIALSLDLFDDPLYQNPTSGIEAETSTVHEFPDLDYHWYRQNPDGTWSHKRGWSEVTNLDAFGEIIYDPQICNRNYNMYDYAVFVGYYAVGISD